MNPIVETILNTLVNEASYQVQYSDYGQDDWTMPCLLMPHRIEQLLNDNSIRKIRIILNNETTIIISV